MFVVKDFNIYIYIYNSGSHVFIRNIRRYKILFYESFHCLQQLPMPLQTNSKTLANFSNTSKSISNSLSHSSGSGGLDPWESKTHYPFRIRYQLDTLGEYLFSLLYTLHA